MANAPKGLFSSRICFFFSVNPLKYVQIHDVDGNLSPESQYARYLMSKCSTGRKPGIEERICKLEEALKKRPPKRKATDSLYLLVITITFDSIKAFAESAAGIFQVRLNHNLFSDHRAMESLKRRQSLVKDAPEPTGRWFSVHDSTIIIKEFASLLGIRSSDIKSIRKKENIIIKAFRLAEGDTQSLRSPLP
ncbi:hypothetical protein DPMN_006481 [Dreissena polymorpha]|uniref:Uncharacterized protein n=1 Tax=Dreissena polymorpha TaxID=45954 RepID=A0A9D4RXF4_DREPO|nr:hypothetical protein DPMN_006481 [Dreissena polymorpha]